MNVRRNLLIIVSIVAVATSAYAYSTGDWLCISGACTIGATTTSSTQLIGGVESISVGASNDTFLFTVDGTDTVTLRGADATGAANLLLDTTGAGAITIGSADVTGFTLTTDGAALNLEGTTAETLTLTASSTNTAVFQGADAAGAANTLLDTTGAGALTIGSADVTEVLFVTDGGTTVFDGVIKAPKAVIQLDSSGNLTDNTVHLVTAVGDYTLPACASATNNWVTVVVRDVSEVISILPANGDTIHISGTSTVIDQDHELDSAGTDDDSGDFVTLTCVITNIWLGTSLGGVWTDGDAT